MFFNSFTDIIFSGWVVPCFLKIFVHKFLVYVQISFAKFGPILVKYLLKFSPIDFVSVMLSLSSRIFLQKILLFVFFFSYCFFNDLSSCFDIILVF